MVVHIGHEAYSGSPLVMIIVEGCICIGHHLQDGWFGLYIGFPSVKEAKGSRSFQVLYDVSNHVPMHLARV